MVSSSRYLWTTITRYSCPYRSKHYVGPYTTEWRCKILRSKCEYNPKDCPIRRRLENKSLEEFFKDFLG